MKNIMKLSVLLILSILLFSCKDNEEAPSLELLTENLSFSAEGGTKTVEVKTNVKGWYLILPSNDSWITLKKGENTIQVTVPENTENEERTITIKVNAGNITRNLKVQQMGNDASLLISSNAFSLPEEGGKVEFDITSNIPYDVVVPENTDWLKLESQTEVDESTKKFVYEVEWNNNDKGREVHLKILGKETGKGITKTISITQRGQSGYEALGQDLVKEDIKLKVVSATASSFQAGTEIEKSFDGDYNTLYHSNWSNRGANYFPIDLEYNLAQPVEQLDYMIYYPRQSGPNGIFKKIEIYVKSQGGQYTKVITQELKQSNTPIKFIFPTPVKNPESVKVKVLSGYGDRNGFASCAEMEFYAYAKEDFDVSKIFTDELFTDVKPEVTEDDITKIPNNFYRNMAYYMKKGTYPREFRIQDYKAWGDSNIMSSRDRSSTYSQLDGVTGIYVDEGEKLIVFVGDTHGQEISLRFVNLDKPGGDGYNDNKNVPLSGGKNIITAPMKGLIYVIYNSQNYANLAPIKIHFASGKVNGYFDRTKHNESDWDRILAAAKYKYFDVVGEKAHLIFETNQYRQFCGSASGGVSVITQFDKLVDDEQEMMGMKKYNRVPHNRALFHVMYHSYMYSTAYRTAYNTSTVSSFLTPDGLRTSPWGPAHELGHTHQVRPLVKWIGTTECTVNIPSLYIQTGWGNKSRIQTEPMGRFNNRYEKAYQRYFIKKISHFEDDDVFCKLVPFWQIKLYLENVKGQSDFYKDLYERARVDKIPNGGNGAYSVNFAVLVSEVSKMDFTEFYESWGYLKEFQGELDDYGKSQVNVSQQLINDAKSKIKAFKDNKPPRAIRYISDANWTLFKHNAPIVKGKATHNGSNISLTGWKNAVAYEVRKTNGDLIFVSNFDRFTINENFDPNTMKVFAIAPDDQEVQVTF
ncbi:M60 family metallopeptidase [Ornithobacterium rhinotracheale]